jgi:hypothetical protein
MTSTNSVKSVGFILTRRYCVFDEVNAFSNQKRIDYMPVYNAYEEDFRIYFFSVEDSLQIIDFIGRRNLDAVFVNVQ